MSRPVPIGFLTFREAVGKIEEVMFAGAPDRSAVVKACEEFGGDVGDGEASRTAAAELWKAVDKGPVRPLAFGGQRRRAIKLADLTREIPAMRRSDDFTSLHIVAPTKRTLWRDHQMARRRSDSRHHSRVPRELILRSSALGCGEHVAGRCAHQLKKERSVDQPLKPLVRRCIIEIVDAKK